MPTAGRFALLRRGGRESANGKVSAATPIIHRTPGREGIKIRSRQQAPGVRIPRAHRPISRPRQRTAALERNDTGDPVLMASEDACAAIIDVPDSNRAVGGPRHPVRSADQETACVSSTNFAP